MTFGSGHIFLLDKNKLRCVHVLMTALKQGIPYAIQKLKYGSLIFYKRAFAHIFLDGSMDRSTPAGGINFQIPTRAFKQDFANPTHKRSYPRS